LSETTSNTSVLRLFIWLWRDYLRPHKWLLVAALLFMAIEGSMLGMLSWLIQPMFDDVFVQGERDMLWVVGLGIMMIFFVRAISSSAQKILMKKLTELAAAGMRNTMLGHLMALDSAYHQTHPPGVLIERIQGDVTAVNSIWAGVATGIGRDVIAVIALFSVAIAVDWKWTLIALIGVPFLVAPSMMAQAYVRKRASAARALAGRMSYYVRQCCVAVRRFACVARCQLHRRRRANHRPCRRIWRGQEHGVQRSDPAYRSARGACAH